MFLKSSVHLHTSYVSEKVLKVFSSMLLTLHWYRFWNCAPTTTSRAACHFLLLARTGRRGPGWPRIFLNRRSSPRTRCLPFGSFQQNTLSNSKSLLTPLWRRPDRTRRVIPRCFLRFMFPCVTFNWFDFVTCVGSSQASQARCQCRSKLV